MIFDVSRAVLNRYHARLALLRIEEGEDHCQV